MARLLSVKNLSAPKNVDILDAVNQALRAHSLYKRDDHYIVKDGEVIIVDEFTGRLMIGRRYAEGLHQAIEAKEKVKKIKAKRAEAEASMLAANLSSQSATMNNILLVLLGAVVLGGIALVATRQTAGSKRRK